MEGAIGLLGVGQGRYSFCQLGDCSNDSECDHVVQGLLDLVVVLDGYLHQTYWTGENAGVSRVGVCTGHVSYCVKGKG